MAKLKTAAALLIGAFVASACGESGNITGPSSAVSGPRFDGGGGLGSGGYTTPPGGGGLGSGGYPSGDTGTSATTTTCLLENGGGLGSGGRTDCPTVTTP